MHKIGRLSPFGGERPCGFVDCAAALPTTPQGQQQKRTYDVLQKPDIFTCYRQSARSS